MLDRCFRNGAAAHLNRAARYRDGVDGLVEVEADGGVGSMLMDEFGGARETMVGAALSTAVPAVKL